MGSEPLVEIELAPPRVEHEPLEDGGLLLRCPVELAPYELSLGEMLRRWGRERPDGRFLAERDGSGGWRELTWAEANQRADAVAQALIDRGLGPERPVMILSGNAIDHALLMLGAFLAGVPVVPVSVAYSLLSEDHAQLRHIAGLVQPGLVYATNGGQFAPAIRHVDLGDAEIVVGSEPPGDLPTTPFDRLLATDSTSAVDRAFETVGPDTVAKILFTSGSTGVPKGVNNTHRMLCSNQQALAQIWPFTANTPPVLVDWLPWNHTFGGNHDFNLILKRGGTMYIDAGRPAPGLFDETVRNIADVAPTLAFNVPAGFGMLVGRLEKDPDLCARLFERLQMIFYAGAALPQDLWDRLEALSIKTLGKRVFMTTSWGSTETAPLATSAHYETEHAGVIGIPVPGTSIKMVPAAGKLELRVAGPNVTPGYHRQPELTREFFDEDGFYRIGDAGVLVDPDDPAKGLVFDGRIAEDFKLQTGTWVSAGTLRTQALAAASPLLSHAVIAGQDRPFVGMLAWLDTEAAADLVGDEDASPADLAMAVEVRAALRDRLAEYDARQQGSSRRIRRLLLLTDPPSADAGEITDKGYINQRAVLERRSDAVERLYQDPPADDVIAVD